MNTTVIKGLLLGGLLFVLLILLPSCADLIVVSGHDLPVTPEQFGVSYTPISIPVSEKSKLPAWWMRSPIPSDTLIVLFHGDSDNIATHFLQIAWATRYGVDALVFDYRGFGESKERATIEKMTEDGLAVLRYTETLTQYKQVVLLGQSLGGHILGRSLVRYSSPERFSLVIFHATFTSFETLAEGRAKVLGVFFFDRKKSIAALSQLPLKKALVIHGENDAVVPYSHGVELAHALGPRTEFWSIPKGRHLDAFYSHDKRYREKLMGLLGKTLLPSENPSLRPYTRFERLALAKTWSIPCGPKLDDELKKETSMAQTHLSEIRFPLDCESACLCSVYADLFRSMKFRRLGQAMSRQTHSQQAQLDDVCRQRVQKECTGP